MKTHRRTEAHTYAHPPWSNKNIHFSKKFSRTTQRTHPAFIIAARCGREVCVYVCVAEEAPQVRLKINQQQQQLQQNDQFQCVGKGNDFGVAQTKVDVGRTAKKTVGEESLLGFFRSWGIIKRQVAMCVSVCVCVTVGVMARPTSFGQFYGPR